MKAVITGAAQGIGAALARWVASHGGASVGLDLQTIGNDIPVDHRIQVDLTDMDAMQRAFAEAYQHLGGIDHMFLNAGTATGTPIAELDVLPYRTVMGVNVDAMIIGTALGMRMMTGGHIVLTASLAGLMPLDLDAVYTASKHAIVGFTRAVGREASERNVIVQALCPGFTETAILDTGIRPVLESLNWPIMPVESVIAGVESMLATPRPGACWMIQAGRAPEPFRFAPVPMPTE